MNNPITNAARAAWAELTTDDAYSYYERTAWYCAQRAVDDSIITITYAVWAIHALGSLAYDCGALFRAQVEDGLHDGDAPALPAAPAPIAALPAVSSAPAYVRRRRNRVAPVTRNAPIKVRASYDTSALGSMSMLHPYQLPSAKEVATRHEALQWPDAMVQRESAYLMA